MVVVLGFLMEWKSNSGANYNKTRAALDDQLADIIGCSQAFDNSE